MPSSPRAGLSPPGAARLAWWVVKPFLLLAIRAEDAAADDEYASILRLGGLAAGDLHRIRMEQASAGDLDPTAYSGVILGGGPFQRSDPDSTKSDVQVRVEAELDRLLDVVVEKDLPFIGLCYGIGMLGAHQGGIVDRSFGEPVGRMPVTVTAAGQADPLFAGLPETFEAFGGHKEGLSVTPRHATVLATSQACPVQAFRVGANVYATQFHPELDAESLATRIDAYRSYGYFPPEEAEALKAVARERDVQWPATILRRFVQRYAAP